MAANGNGLSTATSPTPFSNSLLSSSITSISSTASRHPSTISKTYKQATTLFLTTRFPEALSTIQSLLSPPDPSAEHGDPAPVTQASRSTRVKVWSLYLTILNSIVKLGQEDGKAAFGNNEWRALCNKVRDGEIWEEVVKNGYHGVEGDVDADVVNGLAILLLEHAPDQILTQKRLETYLATSTEPNLDLSGRLGQSPSPGPRMHRFRSPSKGASGANTPRDLNARVKILELYTLHVLVRNNEWDYAREFIGLSAVLDDERRDAFLQALQSLKDDQEAKEQEEKDERQRQEDQLRRDIDEARRLRELNEEREKKRLEEERVKREASEVDYGVDDTPSTAGSSRSRTNPRASDAARNGRPPRSSMAKANGKAVAPMTITARASMIMTRARAIIEQLGNTLNTNPALLMKLLAFIAGMIMMLGNKNIRQRVQRVLSVSWAKVRATAGMGTKVSYI